ncbi:MAG TPA: thioredoxin domain-containing protein [Bryobacteraceae bacterium]|nr:thioredoxin domain-containing protein [Bryobacteraceae bacterium]
MNDERWVDARLRALQPANDWSPNANRAFARLRGRQRRRRSWMWATAMASVAGIVMIALPPEATCAVARVGCRRPATAVLLAPAVALPPQAPQPVVVAKSAERPVKAVGHALTYDVNYKESGSPKAPVVCEIYSDYECPMCGTFYRDVFPQFIAEYVKTGKVRVIHRDFPLTQHPFAKLAARYANAAGELGHYDEVVAQLFASQMEWTANGNVDASVAKVLPAETMRKVRALVESDPKLDATVQSDLSMVARDRIDQTPTIVFVSKGVRRKVAGIQSFDLLRSYLDEMLGK